MTAQPEVTMRSEEAKRVLGLARRSVVLSSREVKVLADEIDNHRAELDAAKADAVRMAHELRELRDIVGMALSEDNDGDACAMLVEHLNVLGHGDDGRCEVVLPHDPNAVLARWSS